MRILSMGTILWSVVIDDYQTKLNLLKEPHFNRGEL